MYFTSLDVPSSALPLHTSLQAVAVRIHSTSLITVCCLYLPPNTVIHQHDLNNLVDQLPAPFIILGLTSMDIALCGVVRGQTLVADRLNRCFLITVSSPPAGGSHCNSILKPGKVATDPLSYRPIALTSCFCKTFERMVNTRLVYVLEKEECISHSAEWILQGRSTLDNLVFLESQIRDAFVRRNHLVSFSLI
ncbi:putative RNA-directed DNA polymerase from transposon X-element [Trichonephila clavipes]|nr:putative RNA-directed DNA polymerase from transposon X-element [Trichonephila clavipes]